MKRDSKEILSEEIEPLLKDIDKWKDKKAGLLYSREIAERNIYDVVKDKDTAEIINETIFNPVHKHQANKVRQVNALFQEINNLELDKEEKYSYKPKNETEPIKIDEATLAQLYIEKEITEKDIRLYGADVNKIVNASNKFTEILDTLYEQMNETLVQYGYAPIEKRKNYFPHFFEDKPDTMVGKFASLFEIDKEICACHFEGIALRVRLIK